MYVNYKQCVVVLTLKGLVDLKIFWSLDQKVFYATVIIRNVLKDRAHFYGDCAESLQTKTFLKILR